jgi:hypothetical protein
MPNTKVLFLGARSWFGLGAVMLTNEIGISHYPPTGRFPDGMIRGLLPCGWAFLHGRPRARRDWRPHSRHWHHCATTLAQTHALAAFDPHYWSLLLAGASARVYHSANIWPRPRPVFSG